MLGNERLGNFSGQIINVVGDKVGHLAIFGMPPGMIHDIELGRVGREELYVNPVPIDVTQQPSGFFVPTEAVPDQQQRPLEMTS
jgi:hypothetical protein